MSFWRELGKSAAQGIVESFVSAAGSAIAEKLSERYLHGNKIITESSQESSESEDSCKCKEPEKSP